MSEDKIRLLICTHCGTIQEMPEYEGHWQEDTWFNAYITGHRGPSHPPTTQAVHIARVNQDDWNDYSKREGILAKLPSEIGMPGTGAGLGQEHYDTKNNFLADAFKCWSAEHGRTTNCADYKSDRKRLFPDTGRERKEIGLDTKERPNTFLCDFCPYNSIVMQRARKDKYGYDYTT